MTIFYPNTDRNTGGAVNHIGETTALNATVGASSAQLSGLKGPQLMVGVGAYPIYIRFGRTGTGAVTSSNGMRLPANTVHLISKPENADSIYHIRDGANSSTISVWDGNIGA